MSDPRRRQGKAREHRQKAVPVEAPSLTAPSETAEPDAPDLLMERAQRPEVVRQPIVPVVAAQDAGVPALLLGHRRVHVPPRLLAQRRQLARQALALRLVLHDEPAIPRPPAVMGEAEEGEGFRTPLAALLTGREPAELDQPRLVLVEHQAELGQSVLEVSPH